MEPCSGKWVKVNKACRGKGNKDYAEVVVSKKKKKADENLGDLLAFPTAITTPGLKACMLTHPLLHALTLLYKDPILI